MDFQTLIAEIDRLTPAQRQAIKLHIEQHEQIEQPVPTTPEALTAEEQIAKLRAIEADFFSGLSPEKIDQIIEDINTKTITTKDTDLWTWITELPKNDR